MELNVLFEENDLEIKTEFEGQIYQISDGGYDIGYQDGVNSMQKVIEEYDNEISLQNGLLENAISELNGKTDPELYENGYKDGFVEGEKSVVDLGKYCSSFKAYLNTFGKKEVVLNLDNATNLVDCFYEKTTDLINTTVERITINCPNEITDMSNFLRTISPYDFSLKEITLNIKTNENTQWNYAFAGRRVLEIINGEPLNMGSNFIANVFQRCDELKEVRIVPNCVIKDFRIDYCVKLSKESLESIVNSLSSETSGLTLILKLQAVNKAFETSEGANDGSNSTEWQTLVNTKPNWTINLA